MNMQSLSVAALCVVLVVVDLSTRLISDGENRASRQDDMTLADFKRPQLTMATREALDKAYESLGDKPAETKEPEADVGMSLAEQMNQQGMLDLLYDGDWRYSLVAVIYPNDKEFQRHPPFALLKKQNVNTNKVEMIKIVDGGVLAGYNLSVISTRQINLTQHQRTVELLMYQSGTGGAPNV